MKVAITGTIGAGKSSVSKLIQDQSFVCYDTDKMVHEYYKKEGALYHDVVALLGPGVLDADQNLSRKKMAALLFDQQHQLQELESLVFNQVKQDILKIFKENPHRLIFFEVPLLFESGLDSLFDAIIVVDADESLRLKRLEQKGIDKIQAEKRMARQWSSKEKQAQADYIILNNTTLDDLKEEVNEVLNAIAIERASTWINQNTP